MLTISCAAPLIPIDDLNFIKLDDDQRK